MTGDGHRSHRDERRLGVCAAIALAIVCAARIASAHKPSDAQVRLATSGSTITGTIEISIRDLDSALALDADGNGEITWAEVTASAPRADAYLRSRLGFSRGGEACTTSLGSGALVDLSDGAYWSLPITAECASASRELAIRYNVLFDVDAQHRGLFTIAGSDKTIVVRDANPVAAALPETPSIVRGGLAYVWTRYDHLLFLLCLLLPIAAVRKGDAWAPPRAVALEAGQIVAAFVLAHATTLALASIGVLTLPVRIAETALALTVLAAAVNNLIRAVDARWAIAFGLGLLHGFGFSEGLLALGTPSIGSLLAYLAGIELGLVAIAAVVVAGMFAIRRSAAYQGVVFGGSAIAAALAAMWAYERWFG